MALPCNVPGCKGERKDDRGYCAAHSWILPRAEWTPAELLEKLQRDLDAEFTGAVPFLWASPGGDLCMPANWLREREDPASVSGILHALYGLDESSESEGQPTAQADPVDDAARKVIVAHVERLMALIRDGAELRRFSSSRESWENLCGRGGWAIVKDGRVLWNVVTVMN